MSFLTEEDKKVLEEALVVTCKLEIGKNGVVLTIAKEKDKPKYFLMFGELDNEAKKELIDKMNQGEENLSDEEMLYVHAQDACIAGSVIKELTGRGDLGASYTLEEVIGEKRVKAYSENVDGLNESGVDRAAFAEKVKEKMIEYYGKEVGEKHFAAFAERSGLSEEAKNLAQKEKERKNEDYADAEDYDAPIWANGRWVTKEDPLIIQGISYSPAELRRLRDNPDHHYGNRGFEGIDLGHGPTGGMVPSKKAVGVNGRDATEFIPDGSMKLNIKVGGQKLELDVSRYEDKYLITDDLSELDEKKMNKLTGKLADKINKGKKLSADEQLFVNYQDRMAVAAVLKDLGLDDAAALDHMPYTKDQLTGKEPVGTFFVNVEGSELNAKAQEQIAALLKDRMCQMYGDEAGLKHFQEFAQLSKLTPEDIEAAKRRESVRWFMTQEAKAHTPLTPTNTPTNTDASKGNTQGEEDRGDIKVAMRDDATEAKILDLMSRPGVKMQTDKDEALNKMIEKYGVDASYKLVLNSVVKPMDLLKGMGEGFRRSGATIDYFANLDTKNPEVMNKIAAITGISVEDMQKQAGVLVDKGPQAQGIDQPQQVDKGIQAQGTGQPQVNGDAGTQVGSRTGIDQEISKDAHDGVLQDQASDVSVSDERSDEKKQYDAYCKGKDFVTIGDLFDHGVKAEDVWNVQKEMLNNGVKLEDLVINNDLPGAIIDQNVIVEEDFALALLKKANDRFKMMKVINSKSNSQSI